MSRSAPPSFPPGLSFLLFQLVAHWGNRSTPRPAGRADVLAAALALSSVDVAAAEAGLARIALLSPYAAELVAAVGGWPPLGTGPHWSGLVTPQAHEANLRLLRQGVALASALLGEGGGADEVGFEGGIRLRWLEPTACRLHPWPFEGRRLVVRAWDPGAAAYRRWTLLPLGG